MRAKLLLFLFFNISLVFAQQLPILPAVYKGYINSACDITGAKLQAYINNELRGETTVYCQNNFCWYGSVEGLEYADLAVSGKSEENSTATIEFYIYLNSKEVKVGSDIFVSGEVKILNFTVSPEQCSILFETPTIVEEQETPTTVTPTPTTTITPTTVPLKEEIPPEKIYEKLMKERIAEVIEQIIPLENITEIEIAYNLTFETKIEHKVERIIEILQKELTEETEKKVAIKIIPIKAKVTVKLIKIKTKDGVEKYFTKIEKTVNASKVIEIVPKDLAETADNIIWIQGSILRIIERDPILEVQPEDNKIAYLVEGNKTDAALETLTAIYEYEPLEETPVLLQNETNITQISQEIQNVTNVSKIETVENITAQEPVKQKIDLKILLIVIIAVIAILALRLGLKLRK